MDYRLCRLCNKSLPVTEFYDAGSVCKECYKARVRRNRLKNLEYYREYDKQRANNPDRVEAREKYRKTPAGKKAVYRATKNYRLKNPTRRLLYSHCEKFLENSGICEQCESNKMVEAHHDDYNKPFEVRWLCRKCHREWHKTHKPIKEETKNKKNNT